MVVSLMEELGIECLVGHQRDSGREPRETVLDRRDAELIPEDAGRPLSIWLPSKELQDLRSLPSSMGPHADADTKLPWRMVYDEAPPYGATTDKAGSPRCRWRPTSAYRRSSCKNVYEVRSGDRKLNQQSRSKPANVGRG